MISGSLLNTTILLHREIKHRNNVSLTENYNDTVARSRSAFLKVPDNQLIFLLGAPRSGTTWIAKFFDSHPDVLYRHEPDTLLRDWRFPMFCPRNQVPQHCDMAADYVRRLLEIRTLKTAGSRPFFRKSYLSTAAHWIRMGWATVLLGVQQAGGSGLIRNVRIPDFTDFGGRPELRVVIKSVSLRGRARLLAESLPGARIVLILRHPCGQVASMMRGTALGKFEHHVRLDEMLETNEAKSFGLTRARLESLSQPEQLAWHWAVIYQKAVNDLAGLSSVRLISYEDVCTRPEEEAKALLEFAGLDWHPQTTDFLARSSHYSGPERYYQVFKNTAAVANRWQTELRPEHQRAILRIARNTSFWHIWDKAKVAA